MRSHALLVIVLSLSASAVAQPGKGNRLAYLDEVDPYYPSHTFPKLTTPMWVGDKDVEAVVILGIDDMKDPKKYETFLRPILRRLQKIDGRAPVSIMTCSVDPKDPQLQTWLKEGLSLECHTFDHPCPLFKGGFDKAKATYDKCVDLMHEVPNSKPVAFRVPCCDSINTPSPRFYAEIFNKVTDKKNFLQIDTSVFNVFTSKDPALPKELVLDDKGQERFVKYLPKDRDFVNTIENYPYPYVIGRLCWQFPCMTPSDWQANHLHKPNNPKTVEDWKAALDCTVVKQGVFCMVFHPHGWIRNDQVVEFIDHAVKKHGKKVKFLTFKEALERLSKNMLEGLAVRREKRGDWEDRLWVFDIDNDGYLDLILSSPRTETDSFWLWKQKSKDWAKAAFDRFESVRSFQVLKDGKVSAYWFQGVGKTMIYDLHRFTFDRGAWKEQPQFRLPHFLGHCIDIDGDGNAELIFLDGTVYSLKEHPPVKLPFKLPSGLPYEALVAERDGASGGLRFLDLDGDGKLDIVFSNEKKYGIYLFENMEKGWSKKIMAGKAGDKNALPMISKNGTNNGFWVHSGHLWWANEDTVLLKNNVDKRSIKDLLKAAAK